jgi:hypothetical protein
MAITKIQAGALPADVITTAAIDDASITHAKLHTTMDLSSKTVTLPTLSTLNTTGNVGIGNDSPSAPLHIKKSISSTYTGGNTGIVNSLFNITNTLSTSTVNAQANIQLGIYDGTYNRVTGIAAVAESATNRKASLVFWTDDENTRTEKLRITGDGNVGIGTDDPDSPLVVNSSSGGNTFKLLGRSADNISSLTFSNAGNTASNYIQGNSSFIRARADGGFHFRKGGTPVTTDTGAFTVNGLNVGIGVTSPSNKLEVDGTIAFTKNGTSGNRWLLIEGADGTYAGTMNIQAGFGSNAAGGAIKLYAHQHATYPGSTWIGRSAGSAGNIMFGNGGTGPASASAIQMVINSSGKVGIGTTNPQAILSLNGGSTCTQTFQSSWSNGIGRISFVGGSTGVDGSAANSTGAKIESLTTAPGGAATGDLKFIVNSGDHFETGMEITHQGTVRLALQGTHTTIGSNADDRAPYGYNNITVNNHADVLWGFNSRLITGGGGHDYEVVSSHGSINNSGIMLTGNGNPESPNNILFFANGGSATAGTVYSPSDRKFTMNSGGSFVAETGSGGAVIRLGDIGNTGTSSHYIELSSNLPGYANGKYNCLKTNMGDMHFAAGGVYTGYISHNSGFVDVSDQSLKENVVTIDGALSKVNQLQGRYFTWIDENQSDDRQIGFIAQEVEAVIPELVTTSDTGIKGVSYGKATALLVEAIKEQQTMIEQLQARLTAAGIE